MRLALVCLSLSVFVLSNNVQLYLCSQTFHSQCCVTTARNKRWGQTVTEETILNQHPATKFYSLMSRYVT